ncbi:hypothetical protein V8C86DRAFT_2738789 [Haematococcus lacustris]
MALVVTGDATANLVGALLAATKDKKYESPKSKKEESSDDEDEYPPDPAHCMVSGPGFAGTHSGAPVKLYVHVKDSRGKRLKEGGEDVAVRVQAVGGSASAQYIEVTVVDNDDGTYTATYTPPIKGNYQVSVELNGLPVAGSPFPVFFHEPMDPALLAAQQEQEAQRKQAAETTALGYTVGHASTTSLAMSGISDEHLRTLYVSNISPLVPIERLRELFQIFGAIQEMNVLGDKKDMAVVTFTTKDAQVQGQQLNSTQFGDRPLNVTAPMSAMAAGVVPANPALAMQMQQIQQMQQAMLQSQRLAVQVAQMRAMARQQQGLAAERAVLDPQKAAEEAVARLNKKFGLSGGTGGSMLHINSPV